MRSAGGRFVVTFNGEIYNYRELRRALEGRGREFRTDTDTEVMLEAFAEWGVEGALPLLNGMFAFAVWDDVEKTLTLARDRLGIKPLFYAETGTGGGRVFRLRLGGEGRTRLGVVEAGA